MTNSKFATLILSFAVISSVHSQNNLKLKSVSENYFTDNDGNINFARLKKDVPVYEMNAKAFIKANVLSEKMSITELNSEKDDLGFSHVRYQLTYNNFPVHNTQLITHSQNGKLVSLNGNLNSVANPVNQIKLTEKKALELALKKVNAQYYKWQNKAEEQLLRRSFNDPEFTFYPKGKTILYSKEADGVSNCHYAYLFPIYADIPMYGANVIVDAESGLILAEENLIHEIDVPSTAITKFSGPVTFTTDSVSPGNYRLRETGRGLGIETYDLNTSTIYSSASDYTNTTTAWTNTTTVDQVGTDAHWGAEMVYDYYLNEHNRNSIDNAGYKLISYADYGIAYTNASWNNFFMTYGSGIGGGFTGLDICGHEISHGLTSKTANLAYLNESGALNESYSDIFGTCIEKYGKPLVSNWLIGDDVGVFRSMSNPNAYGDPDTYKGTNYYLGALDNGGVHTNSGVSNYWFYLLSQGGIGVNDIANSYTVSGIGMTKAAKIAFRALTVYYTPSTNYAAARNLSTQAATDLYGACSNEVFQTKSAWYAVGVGPTPSGTTTPVANFYSFGTSACSLPFVATFINSSIGADTYTWDFGDGSALSTSATPVHTYTSNGSYNVKLKAVSLCASSPDSVTKNAHIIINGLSAPIVSTVASKCDSGSFVLNATGSNQQYWYNNPTGTGTPLYVGTTFTTPVVYGNTTYYAVNTLTNTPIFGGPLSNTIGTGANFPGNTPYDSFSVFQPIILKSVVVYAGTTGPRIIELRNSSNTVLNSTTINLAIGANTVNLNFPVNSGNGYRLGLGPGTAMLYRNNSGVTYPYNIGTLASITGSSLGSTMFFFFYNWEVAPINCTSASSAITASVVTQPSVTSATICSGQQAVLYANAANTYSWSTGATTSSIMVSPSTTTNYSVSATNSCYSVTPVANVVVNPLPVINTSGTPTAACITETVVNLMATPGGGTFTGTGVTGTSFDPTIGVGNYTVSYFYVDNNGCSNTADAYIIVSACVGINEINANNTEIEVYPNPFEDVLFVNGNTKPERKIKIVNALGEVVLEKNIVHEINGLNKLTQGVYFIEITDFSGFIFRKKLIKN